MGWGTIYKHEGYLSRIHKSRIPDEIDECTKTIHRLWTQIAIYMAQTPPAWDDSEYGKRPYAAFLEELISEIREELEESVILRYRLQECAEVMEESPEDVTED